MIRKIVKWPNILLKTKSAPVEEITQEVIDLIQDMEETMRHEDGVGLSAIQVGVPSRIITTRFADCPILINPEIIESTGEKQELYEGCLSLPRVYELISRFKSIRIKWMDVDHESHEQTFVGDVAQCLQHEVDHLNGKFMLDYATSSRRDQIRALLRKGRL